ncbi:hypothetical protein [Nitratireductor sp. XY-223]|uniref:hypothetical protein n=1 Tax=Nitratireductor sp. XY-223 TaxID=2561926 RepID=UPI0010A9CE95|nr:hypothetical protein [Nitratireductor sp. XY-223]
MTIQSSRDDDEIEPVCWACRGGLKPNQQKCVECDSWQNWRMYFAFSSTSLALLVALLSIVTTFFSISDRFVPRGVLVAIANGELMKNEIEFHNNEKFPIVLFGHVKCDLTGSLSYIGEEPGGVADPKNTSETKVIGKIASVNSVERVIKQGEFVTIPVTYTGSGMGFESDIAFNNLESLINGNLARIYDAAVKPVQFDDKQSVWFSVKSPRSCTVMYRTPSGQEIEVTFENRFIERDIVATANRVFFRGQN